MRTLVRESEAFYLTVVLDEALPHDKHIEFIQKWGVSPFTDIPQQATFHTHYTKTYAANIDVPNLMQELVDYLNATVKDKAFSINLKMAKIAITTSPEEVVFTHEVR